jgi:ribosomal-protein-alanine N-acetyltransferase
VSAASQRFGLALAAEIGERVFLRSPEARDRDEFLRVRAQSRAFLEPWEPLPPDGSDPFGPGSFDRLLESSHGERARRFFVCPRETGEIAGQISLGEITRGALQSCYAGYWVAEPHARKGLMTEGLALVVRHAFTTLRLHRVEANIMPHNAPSRALVRRSGFRLEGVAKRFLRIAGRWRDHERWAITIEEWERAGGARRGGEPQP